MDKDFTPYEIALALKELGFDEPCFGFWNENNEFTSIEFDVYSGGNLFDLIKNHNNDVDTNAPTFSQAFRFFREKYKLHHIVLFNNIENNYDFIYGERIGGSMLGTSQTYEEAELECLRKLIEIAKQKN